jgi:uncharacterized protein YjbI with pentapeptide repeats
LIVTQHSSQHCISSKFQNVNTILKKLTAFYMSTRPNIATEGGDVDSIFVGCTIENCEWYWGLFNLAIFVQVKFKNCTFRGTGFSGSKFVECEFTNCEFIKDNLNSECSFKDIAWYGCTQNNCGALEREFRSRR